MSEQVAIFLDRAKFYASDFGASLCSVFCKPSAELKINGRTFQIEKLLGEGGFSFVYLARDSSSSRQFALKKIRCPTADVVKLALAEVDAYKRFKSDNIIRLLDSAVVQDESGEGKIIWLFLPFYERGNLQDLITRSLLSTPPTNPPEAQLLSLFLGTCDAVKAMHQFNPTAAASASSSYPPRATFPSEAGEDDEGTLLGGDRAAGREDAAVFDADDEEEALVGGGGKGKGKGKEREASQSMDNEDGTVPYAHRDIKPANIMISNDGRTPILMDLGSCIPARVHIRTRQEALTHQDLAAEHSSMPYRAPELFDVHTGQTLDEKVDIWSLGCTLFAIAYSYSPFEDPAQAGGSISMAVASGSYRHPRSSPYSEAFKKLIDGMLVVRSEQRPGIDEVIVRAQACLEAL